VADDRRQRLLKQQITRVHMRAKDNGGIERLGPEVDRMLGGGGQRNLHLRKALFNLNQPRHKPAHCAGWGFKPDHALLLARLFGDQHHLVKRRHKLRIERAALRRQAQAACQTLKQRKPEPGFQRGNLAAHRALGQAQLFRRVRQVQVPGGHQKSFDSV